MKIIHCLNQYMPLAFAGTEVYVHTLATLQKSTGHDAIVLTPHIDFYRPGKINKQYVFDDIEVYQYLEAGDPTQRQIHYGQIAPAGLDNFKQLIETLKPDVIHFHELNRSVGLTTAHVKIAKRYGAKVFFTMHLSSYTCNTNILVNNGKLCNGIIDERICSICTLKTQFKIPAILAQPLTAFSVFSKQIGLTQQLRESKFTTILRTPFAISRIKIELAALAENLDQFVCYAAWYKKILMCNGIPEKKITLVPPALVSVKVDEAFTTANEKGQPLKLVCIGRIQPQKGIHLIIEAMRYFKPGQVSIDFYGMPEDTAYYKNCIDTSKGLKNIYWKGVINREKVVQTLGQYDLLCLASTFSEMSPLVIQEAFAAGIPVLASSVYGNIEQITDRHNGILFDFNSAGSLQGKIQELVDNPPLIIQMKTNVVPPISFTTVSNAYLELYSST